MSTTQTAPTQYVNASNGNRFAYRRFGATGSKSPPLVLHIHFRANMDHWDPLFLNTLASKREVIIFDESGVGRSSGTVPVTFQGWADDLIAFVNALGIAKMDLLGFSMGGIAVQMVALTAPQLVRKLIVAGTTASVPSAERIPGIIWPREQAEARPITELASSETLEEGAQSLAISFFYETEHGRAAFEEYWKRVSERTAEKPLLQLLERDVGAKNQIAAVMDIDKPNARNSFDRLGELKIPVLVANGDDDALIPSSRSWELYHEIENAQLIMYPKAGHGFIWQYAELFAGHIATFLDGKDYDDLVPKL